MSDPQTKLGQLIEEGSRRDAVHIAVAPVIAAAGERGDRESYFSCAC